MTRKFYITNVFSQGDFSGNQLATVVDCEGLDTKTMQAIALEFNFSETTFIIGGDAASGFDVRIFTPQAELPFAGHPTLGTAYLLQHQLKRNQAHGSNRDTLVLNMAIGKIPVSFAVDDKLWMKQRTPSFGATYSAEAIAEGLNISASDIDQKFPIQSVSTGMDFVMVPLKSQAALKACKQLPDMQESVLLFTSEAYDVGQRLGVRMLAAYMGIPEDAATGSACGCLAAYLVEHEYLGTAEIDIEVGQGYEIDRASSLFLRASKLAGQFDINVGGKVNLIAEGVLF